jgi:hypothetical protein
VQPARFRPAPADSPCRTHTPAVLQRSSSRVTVGSSSLLTTVAEDLPPWPSKMPKAEKGVDTAHPNSHGTAATGRHTGDCCCCRWQLTQAAAFSILTKPRHKAKALAGEAAMVCMPMLSFGCRRGGYHSALRKLHRSFTQPGGLPLLPSGVQVAPMTFRPLSSPLCSCLSRQADTAGPCSRLAGCWGSSVCSAEQQM